MSHIIAPQEIIEFWFGELSPAQWFTADPELDSEINRRFGGLYPRVLAGECAEWRQTATGRLAEIIVLDQFSRNLFRQDARQFAADGMALVLAQEAVRQEMDQQLPPLQRAFLYLPYMHSESARIHEDAVQLYTALGLADSLAFEHSHRRIIQQFGRYPHRNHLLGRASTAEEITFLNQSASAQQKPFWHHMTAGKSE